MPPGRRDRCTTALRVLSPKISESSALLFGSRNRRLVATQLRRIYYESCHSYTWKERGLTSYINISNFTEKRQFSRRLPTKISALLSASTVARVLSPKISESSALLRFAEQITGTSQRRLQNQIRRNYYEIVTLNQHRNRQNPGHEGGKFTEKRQISRRLSTELS